MPDDHLDRRGYCSRRAHDRASCIVYCTVKETLESQASLPAAPPCTDWEQFLHLPRLLNWHPRKVRPALCKHNYTRMLRELRVHPRRRNLTMSSSSFTNSAGSILWIVTSIVIVFSPADASAVEER